MANTTGVLDGVTFSLERVISFSLGTGNPTETHDLSLTVGEGLLLVAAYSVLDDQLAGMGLDQQTADYENLIIGAGLGVAYFASIIDQFQVLQIGSNANGMVGGELFIFHVKGSRAKGNTGSWSAQTSNARTLQAPGHSTLVQFVAGQLSSTTQTGLGQNAWQLLMNDVNYGFTQVLPNASNGTTTYSTSVSGAWIEILPKEKVRKQRFVTVRDPVVAQPQGNIEVDWDNPIVQKYKLVAAVRYAPNGQALVSERGTNGRGREYHDSMSVTGPVNHVYPTPFGTGWATNLQEAQFYNGGYYFTLDKRYTVALVGAFYAPNNNNETSNGQYIVLGSNFDFRKDSYSTTVRVQENGGNWSFNNASGGFVYVMGRDVGSTLNLMRVWVDGNEKSLTVDASPTTTNAAVAGGVGSGVGNRHAGFADVIRYYFAEAPDVWLARELYDNPWQLLKPRERRIHIPAPVVTHKRKRLL